MTIRVNDRIVHENRPGVVTYVNSDGSVDVRYDSGDTRDYIPENEVLVTATVPVKVTHAYSKGQRMKIGHAGDRCYRIVETCTLSDRPAYKLDNDQIIEEHMLRSAPLPVVSDTDMEEMIAEYLGRKLSYMRDEAEIRKFDNTHSKITVTGESDRANELNIKFDAYYGYGAPNAQAGTIAEAVDEVIRRAQFEKDHQARKLTHQS